MTFFIFAFIWLLIGYFVVRWAHHKDPVPMVIVGLMGMIGWPITLLVFLDKGNLVDKIWGKS